MRIIMSINMSAAGFILLNFDEKTNEWRILSLVDNEGLFDLPKGVIDEGENELEAAKRELFEETNIDINSSKIKKTWVNWDTEFDKEDIKSIEKISLSSKRSRNLTMFFAEADYSVIDEIKILPNPYTNIKEHISYRFIDKNEFESDLTPDYLKDYFRLALNKIKELGEKRGFNDR